MGILKNPLNALFKRTEAGAIARTLRAKISDTLSVEDFGAVGNGTTDDHAAFDAAIAALPSTGGTIRLGSTSYAIANPLVGTKANVRFVSALPLSTLKRIAGGSYDSFAHTDLGSYSGWSFERIGFDGNRVTLGVNAQAIYVRHTERLSFSDCLFRDANVTMGAVRDIAVERCRFLGTRAGVMAASTNDPAAAPVASYGSGLWFADDCHRVRVADCLFHFCLNGIYQNTSAGLSDGLTVEGNSFRADWWNTPYITKRLTPTAYNSGTRVLTVSGGGFTGFFDDYQVLSIPISIVTGASLSNLYANTATAGSAVFGSVRGGDVLEMADGSRAEVARVESTTVLHLMPWESADTFEPITPPAAAQAWRIRRYYASHATFLSDTTITLNGDPVSVHTGETLVGDAGLTPVGVSCRVHAKLSYSGINVVANVRNVSIRGNHFRGSWADQCSVFASPRAQIIGNTLEYGQDVGITAYTAEGYQVHNNLLRYSGTAGISFGASDYSSAVGNVFHSWGVTNRSAFGLAAIDGNGKALCIVGNSATRDTGTGFGGLSSHMIRLAGYDCSGTVISGNVDAGARDASLDIDDTAAPTTNSVIGRDLVSITGAGAGNVDTGGGGSGMAIGGAVGSSTASALLYADASNNLGNDASLLWDATNNRLSIGGGSLGNPLGVRAANASENVLAIYDVSANVRFLVTEAGNGLFLPLNADAGNTTRSSGYFLFQTQRWTGSVNAAENFYLQAVRLDATAGHFMMHFIDHDGNAIMALAGKGGQVAVGYTIPGESSLGTLGQFHVRSAVATTPCIVTYAAASQSANRQEWSDSSGAPGCTISENGYFTTRKTSAPADAELSASEVAFWFDATNGSAKLMIKGKSANGTVVTGSVTLT